MKDWGSDADEKPNRKLRIEAVAMGVAVLSAYSTVACLLATLLLD